MTKVHMRPRQKIFSFWDTKFDYYILSPSGAQTVLRQGLLVCTKPDIINPFDRDGLFEGFSQAAQSTAEDLFQDFLQHIRVLGYKFKNELQSEKTFTKEHAALLDDIKINQSDNHNVCILTSPDDLWMSGLAKASIEIVRRSVKTNIMDFEERGYFLSEEEKVSRHVEILFEEAKSNRAYIKDLADYLKENGLFEEYEDRFFRLVQSQNIEQN